MSNQGGPCGDARHGSPTRWLTIAQAAQCLGYAASTICHMVSARQIPFVKKRGRLRFDRRDLDEWMEKDKILCVDDF